MNWILKVDRGKKAYYLEKKTNVHGLTVGKILKKKQVFQVLGISWASVYSKRFEVWYL